MKRNLFSFLHDHFSYRLYCSYLHDYHNAGEDLCWLVLLRPSFQGDDHFSLLPFPGKATFRQLPLQVQKYIDGLQLFSVAKNGFYLHLLDLLSIEHIHFIIEVELNRTLPFLEMEAIRNGRHLERKVYIKSTNKGLLLHYDNHFS